MKNKMYCLLLALSMSSCAGADKVAQKSMDVPLNQSKFDVSLEANATTGYQWQVIDFDKNLLSLSGNEYLTPKTKLIGAGGLMVFHFELMKEKQYPKETKIRFKYARPWESSGESTTQDMTVHFVTPSK